jgi:membrane-bound metal-dependent hydrolase YbcI (DUF457 family)
MAGFRMHITVSTLCGVAYGAAIKPMGYEPETCFLAAGITGLGGMLPDLDSDSGVPIREMSGLAAAVLPMLLVPRLVHAGLTYDGVIASMALMYLFIRYVGSQMLKHITVHRGMYHSIPAMLIAGLVVFLEYHSTNVRVRLVLAVGVMIGFLSHLILDEIYSVDFNGIRIRLKSSAGSAVKFFSPSWWANLVCYTILAGLGYLAYEDCKQYLGK